MFSLLYLFEMYYQNDLSHFCIFHSLFRTSRQLEFDSACMYCITYLLCRLCISMLPGDERAHVYMRLWAVVLASAISLLQISDTKLPNCLMKHWRSIVISRRRQLTL